MKDLIERIRCWVSEFSFSNGKAVHVQKGDNHTVVFDALRVVIVKDGDCWFAQSIDIDYFATGETLKEVQENFEIGLSATIADHLEAFGNIDRIMRTPQLEDWRPLVSDDHGAYDVSHVSIHNIKCAKQLDVLPFKNISFYQEKAAA